MATTYPGQTQTFPTMQNISVADANAVKQYQQAMQDGDLAAAQAALQNITSVQNKLITAELLNTMSDTCVAIQEEYERRYNISIVVSKQRPTNIAVGDYWFEVI